MSTGRRGARAAALVLGLLLALCGCSRHAATEDDLIHALTGAHSALGASVLTLDQLDKGRTTRAAAQTALEDMGKQLSDAEHSVDSIKIANDGERADRDATARVLTVGAAELLDARDELALHGRSATRDRLTAADADITRLMVRLRGGE